MMHGQKNIKIAIPVTLCDSWQLLSWVSSNNNNNNNNNNTVINISL